MAQAEPAGLHLVRLAQPITTQQYLNKDTQRALPDLILKAGFSVIACLSLVTISLSRVLLRFNCIDGQSHYE